MDVFTLDKAARVADEIGDPPNIESQNEAMNIKTQKIEDPQTVSNTNTNTNTNHNAMKTDDSKDDNQSIIDLSTLPKVLNVEMPKFPDLSSFMKFGGGPDALGTDSNDNDNHNRNSNDNGTKPELAIPEFPMPSMDMLQFTATPLPVDLQSGNTLIPNQDLPPILNIMDQGKDPLSFTTNTAPCIDVDGDSKDTKEKKEIKEVKDDQNPKQNANEHKDFNQIMFGGDDDDEDDDLGVDSSSDDDQTNNAQTAETTQNQPKQPIESLRAVALDDDTNPITTALSESKDDDQPTNAEDKEKDKMKNKSTTSSMDVDSGSESSSEEEEKPMTEEEKKVQKMMEERREMYEVQAQNDRETLDLLRSLEHLEEGITGQKVKTSKIEDLDFNWKKHRKQRNVEDKKEKKSKKKKTKTSKKSKTSKDSKTTKDSTESKDENKDTESTKTKGRRRRRRGRRKQQEVVQKSDTSSDDNEIEDADLESDEHGVDGMFSNSNRSNSSAKSKSKSILPVVTAATTSTTERKINEIRNLQNMTSAPIIRSAPEKVEAQESVPLFEEDEDIESVPIFNDQEMDDSHTVHTHMSSFDTLSHFSSLSNMFSVDLEQTESGGAPRIHVSNHNSTTNALPSSSSPFPEPPLFDIPEPPVVHMEDDEQRDAQQMESGDLNVNVKADPDNSNTGLEGNDLLNMFEQDLQDQLNEQHAKKNDTEPVPKEEPHDDDTMALLSQLDSFIA